MFDDDDLILLAAIADYEDEQTRIWRRRIGAARAVVEETVIANAYITEDASQFYITEDASSVYVTEA